MQVLHQRLNQADTASLAALVFDLIESAKLQPGATQGLGFGSFPTSHICRSVARGENAARHRVRSLRQGAASRYAAGRVSRVATRDLLGSFEDLAHGRRQLLPGVLFDLEFAPSGFGELVELCSAIVL